MEGCAGRNWGRDAEGTVETVIQPHLKAESRQDGKAKPNDNTRQLGAILSELPPSNLLKRLLIVRYQMTQAI